MGQGPESWTTPVGRGRERISTLTTMCMWEIHLLVNAVFVRPVLHRYKLPFKRFAVPPPSKLLFKYRKSAQRLSDWI
eukprot:3011942-Prymnesium_polylepis.1